ncbi:MAG: DUF4185 domain-containing protein [Cyclobacteriaceae bacterium]
MIVRLFIFFFILICIDGCDSVPDQSKNPAVEQKQWTDLFIRNQGWFGGDGIFAIPLDGREFIPATKKTRTLFTFGDTMIGYHNGETLEAENFHMVNNSVGILDGRSPDPENISFYWDQSNPDQPQALFVPNTPNSKPGDYYWLGDGFVNTKADSTLYIFAYLVHEKDTAGTGGFAFEQIGVTLLSIPVGSEPPYKDHLQIETPFFDLKTGTTFGSAIYVNTDDAGAPDPDGYIYVYAVSQPDKVKGLVVARVLPSEFTDFDKWRFWDGGGWNMDMTNATFIAEDVSNEMSVSPLPDGRFVLTYQYLGMSPAIVVEVGESLVGPFTSKKTIYKTKENDQHSSYFTYNVKAFPHLSSPDSLLVGYNVNSFDFWTDILVDPNLYRPRFLQLSFKNLE